MKVLLVRVPVQSCHLMRHVRFSYFAEPMGLHCLAERLAAAGMDTAVHDMFLDADPDAFLAAVGSYHPDVVGFSSLVLGYDNVTLLSGLVKGRFPGVATVVGGPCTFMPPRLLLEHGAALDYVIRGEGEEALPRLCQAIAGAARDGLRDVDGLAWRDGAIVENPRRCFIDPAEIRYPLDRYVDHAEAMEGSIMTAMMGRPPIAFLEASRGCGFGCAFCGVHEPYRKRPPENVVAELRELHRRHGVRKFVFADYTLTADRAHAERLCELLVDARLPVEWACDTRVDRVSPPLLRLMKRAGCRVIFYGVESFRQETLDAYGKRIDPATIERALRDTRRAGIQTLAYMMLGAPGETREMIRENAALLRRARVDWALTGIARLLCGTALFERAVSRGVIDRRAGEARCLSGEIDQLPVWEDTLSREELEELEAEARRAFYHRPGYALQRLRGARDAAELWRMARFVGGLAARSLSRAC